MKWLTEDEAAVPVNTASSGKVAGLGANGDTDVLVNKKRIRPDLLRRVRLAILAGNDANV